MICPAWPESAQTPGEPCGDPLPRTAASRAAVLAEAGEQAALVSAQQRLEGALAEVKRVHSLSPSGIFIQVSYGLTYFRERVTAKLTDDHSPSR